VGLNFESLTFSALVSYIKSDYSNASPVNPTRLGQHKVQELGLSRGRGCKELSNLIECLDVCLGHQV